MFPISEARVHFDKEDRYAAVDHRTQQKQSLNEDVFPWI